MDLNKIEFHDLLGAGAFGKVRLAKKFRDVESTDEESHDEGEESEMAIN